MTYLINVLQQDQQSLTHWNVVLFRQNGNDNGIYKMATTTVCNDEDEKKKIASIILLVDDGHGWMVE